MECAISSSTTNVDIQGPLDVSSAPVGIITAKPVQALTGDRIWLISGAGRPRKYGLSGTFVATDVQRANSETEMNEVWGSTERWLQTPVRIDTEPWFKELLRATGNFAFGLQRINDPRITRGLLDLSLDHTGDISQTSHGDSLGGYFGTPEVNKLVETAAVDAVTAAYRADGWTVVSREDRNYGYDLHCSRSQMLHHVEVKGVRGRDCSFILTANEREFSQERASFRLCVVTNALDPKHLNIQTFTSTELSSRFEFEPLVFSVKLKQRV